MAEGLKRAIMRVMERKNIPPSTKDYCALSNAMNTAAGEDIYEPWWLDEALEGKKAVAPEFFRHMFEGLDMDAREEIQILLFWLALSKDSADYLKAQSHPLYAVEEGDGLAV